MTQPEPGPLCESCGRRPATETLERRRRRRPLTVGKPLGEEAMVCHQCWLDILYGYKPRPG